MKNRNVSQMQSSETKATGGHGNHNWLLWQQSLYLNMNSAKTESEKILFGLLCNDTSFANHSQSVSFEESLYYHFRTYFNNEVMRRYIVVRKMLQNQRKIVLFNEPSFIESKFDNLSPLEILKFIYPGGAAQSSLVSTSSFIESLGYLTDQPTSYIKGIHFLVIFDFLDRHDPKETKRGHQYLHQIVPPAKLCENYRKWLGMMTSSKYLDNEEAVTEACQFSMNQLVLLTLPLIDSLSVVSFNAIAPLIRQAYSDYDQIFSSTKEVVNAPLVLCCGNFFLRLQNDSPNWIDKEITD